MPKSAKAASKKADDAERAAEKAIQLYTALPVPAARQRLWSVWDQASQFLAPKTNLKRPSSNAIGSNSRRVRIISFNVHNGFYDPSDMRMVAPKMMDMIHQLQPDVLGLQEVAWRGGFTAPELKRTLVEQADLHFAGECRASSLYGWFGNQLWVRPWLLANAHPSQGGFAASVPKKARKPRQLLLREPTASDCARFRANPAVNPLSGVKLVATSRVRKALEAKCKALRPAQPQHTVKPAPAPALFQPKVKMVASPPVAKPHGKPKAKSKSPPKTKTSSMRPGPAASCDLHSSHYASEGRCMIMRCFPLGGKHRLCVASLQLDVWDDSGATREAEAKAALQCLKASTKPTDFVVVLGDFNAVRRKDYSDSHWAWIEANDSARGAQQDTAVMKLFEKHGFRDAADLVGVRLPLSVWPGKRVDFALVSANFRPQHVERVFVAPSAASDHYPLVVDLILPK